MRDDELGRITAYADYKALPNKERSVQALYESYVRLNREGVDVPTTTRGKVYAWAKEDKWAERLVIEQRELQAAQARVVLDDKKRQIHSMHAMLPLANEAFITLLSDAEEGARLRAIFGLWDRLGFVPVSKGEVAKADLQEAADGSAPRVEVPAMPADDASDEEWIAFNLAQREAGAGAG